MNKKRIILLLLIAAFMMPVGVVAKTPNIKLRFHWKIPTRSPIETPFEVCLDDSQTLCIHFVATGTCTLTIKTLDGQDVYTTTVSALSGQDVFIDLKQLPSGTYLLSLKNEYLEATGYLIL